MSSDGYPCPECGAAVVWSLRNCRPGAETSTRCAKHRTQSRMDFRIEDEWFCFWAGVARRDENGDVKLYHSDGKTLLRKRLN